MAVASPAGRERRLEVEEPAPLRRILTLGGHDFTSRPPDRAVCELMLRLGTERAGGRPRICILPTASGDTSEQIGRFYAAFGERPCEPSDLSLFRLGRQPMALRDHLLAQDLLYVGGGSLVNLLAVWEAHEIGAILSLAWRRGIVLAGQSAGAMCWFEAGITKSSGRPLRPPGSACWAAASASTTTTSPSVVPPTSTRSAVGCRGGTASTTTPACSGRARTRPPRSPPAVAPAPTGFAPRARGSRESALPARFLAAPAPAALREDIAEFRRIKSLRKRAGWLS